MYRLAILVVLLFSAPAFADNGRYQMVPGMGSTVWILDTQTGKIRICAPNTDHGSLSASAAMSVGPQCSPWLDEE